MVDLSQLRARASDRKKEFRKLIRFLKKRKPADLDKNASELHYKAFEGIDCLDCAGCCKNLSPFLTDRDIEKIASALKLKPSDVVEKYLKIDEEKDFVFRQSPCPFLLNNNHCSIYDHRPKACREYPHTDRKRFIQLLDLSLKNTSICPAVFEVMEGLREQYL